MRRAATGQRGLLALGAALILGLVLTWRALDPGAPDGDRSAPVLHAPREAPAVMSEVDALTPNPGERPAHAAPPEVVPLSDAPRPLTIEVSGAALAARLSGELSMTVFDAEGQPVEGARVSLSWPDPGTGWRQVRRTESDAHGLATFVCEQPASFRWEVNANGHVPWRSTPASHDLTEPVARVVHLEPSPVVELELLDALGDPLVREPVSAALDDDRAGWGDVRASAMTDEQGRARLDGLLPGSWTIHTAGRTAQVSLGVGQLRELVIQLPPERAVLEVSGQVLVAGRPVPGAWVSLDHDGAEPSTASDRPVDSSLIVPPPPNPTGPRRRRTADDGRFHFGTYAERGEQQLAVAPWEDAPQRALLALTIAPPARGLLCEVDWGRLVVEVLHADGSPAETDLEIVADGEDGPLRRVHVHAEAGGSDLGWLPAGHYTLRPGSPPAQYGAPFEGEPGWPRTESATVQVTTGAEAHATLVLRSGSIAGAVDDPGRWWVRHWPEGRPQHTRIALAEGGTYHLDDLPEGSWRVHLVPWGTQVESRAERLRSLEAMRADVRSQLDRAEDEQPGLARYLEHLDRQLAEAQDAEDPPGAAGLRVQVFAGRTTELDLETGG